MISNKNKIIAIATVMVISITLISLIHNGIKKSKLKKEEEKYENVIFDMYPEDSLHSDDLDIEADKDFDENGNLKYPLMSLQDKNINN